MGSSTDVQLPLTLSEQLNAMLLGWLDRHDPDGEQRGSDEIARAVVTVGASELPEIEAFCARWELTVRHTARHSGRWAVVVVEGSPQLVRGFTEITSMA